MRYLAIGAVLGAVFGLLWRAAGARRRTSRDGEVWTAERESPWASGAATADAVPPPPPEPTPPSEADPVDREIESRLDPESKYERFREDEESERAEAAARLQADPLVERLEPDTDAER